MPGDVAVWAVREGTPTRVPRAEVELERNLEEWIEAEPDLLADGLRIVGRQVHVQGGPIDLLGIDVQERWVVVELKRGRLRREALAQAIDYASSVAVMPADELLDKARPYTEEDADLAELAERSIGDEGTLPREVAVILAGTRSDPGLKRMAEYLSGRFGFPVSIVTFDVFQSDREIMLMREVIEEVEPKPGSGRRSLPLEEIIAKADRAGVGEQFRRAVAMSEGSGLYVRPHVRGVTIAPPQNHSRALLWFRPIAGGRMNIYVSVDSFEEFFPPMTRADVVRALGDEEGAQYAEPGLSARLDTIETFLGTLPLEQDV